MSDGIMIKVEGIEDCLRNLKAWQIVKKEAVKKALLETGFKVETDAKTNCLTFKKPTGRLMASISTNWSGSPMTYGHTGGKAKMSDGVGRPDGEAGMTVVVGTNVEYSCVVGSRQQVYEPIKKQVLILEIILMKQFFQKMENHTKY